VQLSLIQILASSTRLAGVLQLFESQLQYPLSALKGVDLPQLKVLQRFLGLV